MLLVILAVILIFLEVANLSLVSCVFLCAIDGVFSPLADITNNRDNKESTQPAFSPSVYYSAMSPLHSVTFDAKGAKLPV